MPVNAQIGEGTRIMHPELVNLYGCKIGQKCMIGCFVEVGPGVIIGDWCRIQSMCFIPEGIHIGDNVFVGPGTVFLNDKYPPDPGFAKKYQTVVEDNVVIGGCVVVLPNVRLGRGCRIGAGAIVTRDVKAMEIVKGLPARETTGGWPTG